MQWIRGTGVIVGCAAAAMGWGEEASKLQKYDLSKGSSFRRGSEIEVPRESEASRRMVEEGRRRARSQGERMAGRRMEEAKAATSALFTADGRFLIVAGPKERILVIDTASGKATGRFPVESLGSQRLALSRDGRLLAATDGEGNATIWEIGDVPSRDPKALRSFRILEKGEGLLGLAFLDGGRILASAGAG